MIRPIISSGRFRIKHGSGGWIGLLMALSRIFIVNAFAQMKNELGCGMSKAMRRSI
jgi:hypothetical protein